MTKEIAAKNYKEEQKYYRNKTKYGNMIWNSSKNGTLNKENEKAKEQRTKFYVDKLGGKL